MHLFHIFLKYLRRNIGDILLLGILLFSFLIRAHNIYIENPVFSRESHWTFSHSLFAVHLMSDGFGHPPFYQIVLLLGDWLYFLFGLVTGFFKTPLDFEIIRRLNFVSFFVWGRFINIALGLVSIYVIYLIGKKIHNKKTGLLAAFFLAFLYPHIEACRTVDPHILLTLLINISFLFTLDIFNFGRLRNYLWSGFFIGLAVATRFTGVLAVISPLLAHFYRNGKRGLPDRKLYYGLGGGVILGFFAGFPTLPWDLKGLFHDFLVYKSDVYLGEVCGYAFMGWLYYPRMLYGVIGPLFFMFSVMGVIYCLADFKSAKKILLASFPILFYLAACNLKAAREYWIFPIFPSLILISAYFLVSVTDRGKPSILKAGNIVLLAAALFTVIPSFKKIIAYENTLSQDELNKRVGDFKQKYLPGEERLKQLAAKALKEKNFPFLGVIQKVPVSSPTFMSNYQGLTTYITGNVSVRNYKGGPIFIVVRGKPYAANRQDIAAVAIDRPGKYCIGVPFKCGRVLVLSVPLWYSMRLEYADAFVDVNETDINDVNLEIK